MRRSGGLSVRTVAGTGATLALAVLYLALRGGEPPDAGVLDPILAEPPEAVEVHVIGRGQTFGEVLEAANLEWSEQQALLLAFQERASPRRLRAGTEVTVRRRADDGAIRGVDVQLSRDETVRVAREDLGWNSSVVTTPTWTDTLYVAGEIQDNLWTSAMTNDDLRDVPIEDRGKIVDQLDRIFGWQVDFSRQIQRGDYYRVAVQREVRPDGSMRDGTVLAAQIVNKGRPVDAVYFDPNGDGRGTYYDLDGKSVRRAFLKAPLQFRRISGVVSNRFHPILKRWRSHNGVDYAADRGTPVWATGDGVVTNRSAKGSYGNMVEIRHGNGFVTRYAHLSGYAPGLALGQRVAQGETIGYVGMTGLATGPHLHYELLQRGAFKDPLNIVLPAGDPVPTDAWDRWLDESIHRAALLGRLPAPPSRRVAQAAAGQDGTSEEGGAGSE
jgi:murein DD-endopeptidase MepM/ murein hydrolase activator NlpD